MHLLVPTIAAILAGLVPSPRFAPAEHDAAWALLPRENPRLPAWALALVKSLPRTTGAMLELDYLHRAENPLGAALAAKIRWLAADALGSEYGKASALADLQRAGATQDEIRRVVSIQPNAEEKALFAFARQMCTAAYLVTDGEFARLLEKFGPERMTAIVHSLAYCNFHNRIIIALGVKPETDAKGKLDPCPPVGVKFDVAKRPNVPTPARPSWDEFKKAKPAKSYDAPEEWKEVTFSQLEEALANQKARKGRMPLPDPKRYEGLPPGLKKQAETIMWNTISAGYQPAMTIAWFAALREFQQESKMDRVFNSSLFWIVTRSNDCFY